MLKQLRSTIVSHLLQNFNNKTNQLKLIDHHFKRLSIPQLFLDHVALIDLPGPNTGISEMSQIFSSLGFLVQGRGYLAKKQNDFLWMAESDSIGSNAKQVLPQLVIADFRLDEMPITIKKIIEKYAKQSPLSPLKDIQKRMGRIYVHHDPQAALEVSTMVNQFFQGRRWSLPTKKEYLLVHEFNQLLAWVLLFGRCPNHFTLSIHLLDCFNDLDQCLKIIENDVKLSLNHENGIIKGDIAAGMEQASTISHPQEIMLEGGPVNSPQEFVEFIWRFPIAGCENPSLWEDYHTGFIPEHADYVIESLVLA